MHQSKTYCQCLCSTAVADDDREIPIRNLYFMHKGKTRTSARKGNLKMDFPIFKTAKYELHDACVNTT